MGRLTLNVLLSFAQFEREVILHAAMATDTSGRKIRGVVKIRPDSNFWGSGLFLVGFICIRRRIPKHREWRTVYGPRRDDSNDYVDGTGEAADFPAAGAA